MEPKGSRIRRTPPGLPTTIGSDDERRLKIVLNVLKDADYLQVYAGIKKSGREITRVTSSLELLEAVSSYIHLVFITDQFDNLREIRERYPAKEVLVIFLTPYSNGNITEACEAGASFCLPLPIDPSEPITHAAFEALKEIP